VIDMTRQTDERVMGGAMTPGGILLHHTGSTNEAGDYNWLAGESARYSLRRYRDLRGAVSCHQLVKRDGRIIQIVPFSRVAFHAGYSSWLGRVGGNEWMLGIEICNDGEGEEYTQEQYRAVAETIAYNCARFRIPDHQITSHRAVREEWLRKYPGTAEGKSDPVGLDVLRLAREIAEVRAAWPSGWNLRWAEVMGVVVPA
jgi:N-acetyl-anhydromuramyl-L-alanine amidase AmpD